MVNSAEAAGATYETFADAFIQKHPGTSAGSMFGMPILKIDKKSFAGSYDGAAVFKLPEGSRAEALGLKGAEFFDPMGGRPMKEWVVVPATHAKQWPAFAESALRYVAENA
jgi:hypothetical protein